MGGSMTGMVTRNNFCGGRATSLADAGKENPAKSAGDLFGRDLATSARTQSGGNTITLAQQVMIIAGTMEITDFVFSQREDSLLTGNYNAYRTHTTRKLHKVRQRLGQTTPKGRKYTAKRPVTADDVNNNVEYVL